MKKEKNEKVAKQVKALTDMLRKIQRASLSHEISQKIWNYGIIMERWYKINKLKWNHRKLKQNKTKQNKKEKKRKVATKQSTHYEPGDK